MVEFELFIKYFSGKCNPEEAMRVEDFAAASPEQYAYFKSLHESWIAAGAENYQLPDVQKEWETFKAKYKTGANPRQNLFKTVAMAATVALLLGLSGYFLFFYQNPGTKILTATAAQTKTFLLQDSSVVTLLPHATLQYPEKFKKELRETRLSGDASFEIKHNPEQPFIIHLQYGLKVRVTGTSFSIHQSPEMVTVQLREGSVLFYNKKDTLSIAAKQTGKYLIAQQKFILQLPIPEAGSFSFTNTPLKEVAARLNRYFHVRIQFQNPALNNCKLSAGFEQQTLKEIINVIAITFNLDYKIENTNIYLNGEGCN